MNIKNRSKLLGLAIIASVFGSVCASGFEQQCFNNVSGLNAPLSPEIAEQCVNHLGRDSALVEQLKNKSRSRTAYILSYNSALADLGNSLRDLEKLNLKYAVGRAIGGDVCPLCDLGLGPQPEKAFAWVEKNFPEKLNNFKLAGRTWDALAQIIRQGLEPAGVTSEKWNSFPLASRLKVLSKWADGMADNVLAQQAVITLTIAESIIPPIMAELGYTTKTGQLASILINLRKEYKTAMGQDVEATVAPWLTSSVTDALGELDAAPEQNNPMDYMYEAPTELKSNQSAALSWMLVRQSSDGSFSGPLADELRGTKPGEEILAFYADPVYRKAGTNMLRLVFEESTEGELGGWDEGTNAITISIQPLNKWMAMQKPRFSADKLFSEGKELRALAQYIAETFVHEATHQRQTAWGKMSGFYGINEGLFRYSQPRFIELEVEAFAMENLFRFEKKYVSMNDSQSRTMKTLLKDGVKGLKRLIWDVEGYRKLKSLQGEVAILTQTDKDSAIAAAWLKRDANGNRLIDTRLKWYQAALAWQAANEKKFESWRAVLLKK